ncbi:methyltransferase [Marispirochaeta sp.]|uniref:class I SAM-dependent RNA methyltransferase n=1 Tax=Marispirochaeta sp. TaxID=2038653 RepID=UPI0029C68358|nr:methyltransferase [Marispirochaeta sp.]
MPLRIENLVYGGNGLARENDFVWFVPYSAPGDLLDIEKTDVKTSYGRGKISRIIESSALRTDPPCPLFGRCGGCQWQHIRYPAQLAAKQEIIGSMAKRNLMNPPSSVIIQPSPSEWEYRCRISLHRQDRKIGYHAIGSRNLVAIRDCPIAEAPLRSWLENPPLSKLELEALPERFELRNKDGTVRIVHAAADEAFEQANRQGNTLLRNRLREHLLNSFSNPRIFDLFCGDGNLSLPLTDTAESIDGWDISAGAIERARTAAASNSNLNYSRGNVSAIYGELRRKSREIDILILDPPRKGIKKEAPELAKLGIPLIAYVSCNPASLIRDLKEFEKAGYTLNVLEAFDMFPQTYHMECLALLSAE